MVIRTIAHPHNLKLVRGIPAGATNPGIDESVSDRALAIPNPGVTKAAREHAESFPVGDLCHGRC